jgi:uncharacterized membrane protein YciS (DUF1049 family)
MNKVWLILSNKVFWTLLIGGLITLVQYLLAQAYWPNLSTLFSIILEVLTVIASMIAGAVQSAQLAQTKKQLAIFQNKMNPPK